MREITKISLLLLISLFISITTNYLTKKFYNQCLDVLLMVMAVSHDVLIFN